jgi:beta-glucosidase-like glycosyl hydrolase
VPSEDPFLTAQYAIGYTRGLQQGPDPKVPMAAVTLKHWLGNSVEGGVGHASRHTADAKISAYDLANTYYPGFEMTIKSSGTLGGAMGVMCSYNMLNGKPTCGNPDLTAVLRNDWG